MCIRRRPVIAVPSRRPIGVRSRFAVGVALLMPMALWAGSDARCAELTNSLGMKLVEIPAGEFLMGMGDALVDRLTSILNKKPGPSPVREELLEVLKSQRPKHRVVISKPFFLGAYEVTQGEFAVVAGYNPSAFSPGGLMKDACAGQDTGRHPVERVTWEQAEEFCRQLSAMPEEVAAGRTYRLPTEAQWEYACRTGTTTTWYWGNRPDPSVADDYEWSRKSTEYARPVGQKKPNAWGLYDMAGNVSEWCADWYDLKTYENSPSRDPAGPEAGSARISRGGPSMPAMMSSSRKKNAPQSATPWLGFRVACDVAVGTQAAEPTTLKPARRYTKMQPSSRGLRQQGNLLILAEEAEFIRFANSLSRLRMACVNLQRECNEAQRQLGLVRSAQIGALRGRAEARTAMAYSESWREFWQNRAARSNARDALQMADLSAEGLRQWRAEAGKEFDSSLEVFGEQARKLRQTFVKMRTKYDELSENAEVKQAITESGTRLGPGPSALAAEKKLAYEEGEYARLKGE